MMETIIFKRVDDVYDGQPCIRIEGRGDIPAGAFQVEHFANEEWAAWYEESAAPAQ